MTQIVNLSTPALVVDRQKFDANVAIMTAVRPGLTLRPHIKAHKSTALAHELAKVGHTAFTCATPREIIGMAQAGLGSDLLLANEIVDPVRLRTMAALLNNSRITVAIDSDVTARMAAENGIKDVLIDVNVGMPRCGVSPERASALATFAVSLGLNVRGVMGYEGHLMAVADRDEQRAKVRSAMGALVECFDDVRAQSGDDCTIISAGGTGTFDLYDPSDPVLARVNEVQAGSYALMDSHYGALELPFVQALYVIGTVISVSDGWAVIDVGLKSLGMDHGNPTIEGASIWFCSDEHITFSMKDGRPLPVVGSRVLVQPAHIDPTIALHEVMYVVDQIPVIGVLSSETDKTGTGKTGTGKTGTGGTVIDTWPVNLRHW
jgi:D-serine deaminase-like pyridoxal phosphate-dependent protein